MIETENISKTYRLGETKVRALRKVSLHIDDGEMVAIIGPSGSGKSTLLAILGCLDVPSKGIYRIDGQEVMSMNERQLLPAVQSAATNQRARECDAAVVLLRH